MLRKFATTVMIISLTAVAATYAEAAADGAVKGTKETSGKTKASALVDINLSSRDELMTLPGIGKEEADKIIAGRPYLTKTELLSRHLISENAFYGILDKIQIDWDAFAKSKREEEKKAFRNLVGSKAKKVKMASGVVYQDLVNGSGKTATIGKSLTVHYIGWLKNGTQFDSSRGGEPITFTLGKGEVIRGWDEGLQSMKVGGKRLLTIPPRLGYGKEGAPGRIPPNATLIFEVELLAVE